MRSPPRGCGGKRLHEAPDVRGAALIPSLKRNTYAPARDRWADTAHPRACGKHFRPAPLSVGPCRSHPKPGKTWTPSVPSRSSPHARGTRNLGPGNPISLPQIPACAGNTFKLPNWPRSQPAHPRMRGEHLPGVPNSAMSARSSRACGKHAGHLIFSISRPPLIPAYAGNTEARRCPRRGEPAHSRMRGEHSPRSTCFAVMPRLSPHARGTLLKSPTH